MAISLPAPRRSSPGALTGAKTELRARAAGAKVFLDVDVEAGVVAREQERAAT